MSSEKNSNKPAVHYLLSVKQQTDRVRDELVNTVQHSEAKERDFSQELVEPRSEQKGVNVGLGFIRRTQTQLQMIASVALSLLDVSVFRCV